MYYAVSGCSTSHGLRDGASWWLWRVHRLLWHFRILRLLLEWAPTFFFFFPGRMMRYYRPCRWKEEGGDFVLRDVDGGCGGDLMQHEVCRTEDDNSQPHLPLLVLKYAPMALCSLVPRCEHCQYNYKLSLVVSGSAYGPAARQVLLGSCQKGLAQELVYLESLCTVHRPSDVHHLMCRGDLKGTLVSSIAGAHAVARDFVPPTMSHIRRMPT